VTDLKIHSGLTIPESEVHFRFSRSGGPGGQNVNKTETRVELLFDLGNTPQLTADQRQLAQERLATYLTADGILRLVVSETRNQVQNRRIAERRFQELLRTALRRRRPRTETRVPAAARAARLEDKRRRGSLKMQRGLPDQE
jgi:ribosome-associated protein